MITRMVKEKYQCKGLIGKNGGSINRLGHVSNLISLERDTKESLKVNESSNYCEREEAFILTLIKMTNKKKSTEAK